MFRRDFLKKGITCSVGMTVGANSLQGASNESANEKNAQDAVGAGIRGDKNSMILITKKTVRDQLTLPMGVTWIDSAWLAKEWTRVKDRLNKGASLFFLGTENIRHPQDLFRTDL